MKAKDVLSFYFVSVSVYAWESIQTDDDIINVSKYSHSHSKRIRLERRLQTKQQKIFLGKSMKSVTMIAKHKYLSKTLKNNISLMNYGRL